MSQSRSMEVKVGILILVALALLAGFIVVMGGLSFQPTYRVNVDFTNPGGLKAGAPVRLAGVRVGKVTSIDFRGGEPQAIANNTLIRVVAELENQYQPSIHQDSKWFVSTQGVLGEFYLAVDPGSADSPPLQDGAAVQGISPPRLDLLLSEAYELLHRTYLAISENDEKIRETFDGLHRTLKGSGEFFDRNAQKLDQIVANVETLSVQSNDVLTAAKRQYIDNPRINSIIRNVETGSQAVSRDLPPLLTESRGLVKDVNRVTDVLGSDEQLATYTQITADARELTKNANKAARGANTMLEDIRAGKGSLGALMADEAVYDDLQELLRDLKHNPWKIFWRE
jgi:phospholipid/cholesterol/gamma-HCH transport system substrate-binding protein